MSQCNIKPQNFKLHPSEPVRTSKQALQTFVGCIWVWQVENGWRDERCFSSAHFLHKCYATLSATIIIKPPNLPSVTWPTSACVTSLPFLENGSELFELHFCFKNLRFHYMNLWTYDHSTSYNYWCVNDIITYKRYLWATCFISKRWTRWTTLMLLVWGSYYSPEGLWNRNDCTFCPGSERLISAPSEFAPSWCF